jgi:hypothetical protein
MSKSNRKLEYKKFEGEYFEREVSTCHKKQVSAMKQQDYFDVTQYEGETEYLDSIEYMLRKIK